MTWVKICGMTNLEDALAAVEAGADAVGFVFYEKSPRCVSLKTVREILAKLPESVARVGVFVNEKADTVSAIADQAGLTTVQFHGDEYLTPQQYAANRDAFFCLPAGETISRSRQRNGSFSLPQFPNRAAIMLDSSTREKRGGTGTTFAWGEATGFVRSIASKYRVIVAGGLNSANVRQAIDALHPWGVDVVSGVEARPGKKDPEKVRAFVRAVREADGKVS
jgi:phosphoribosylanthranilate isomerase